MKRNQKYLTTRITLEKNHLKCTNEKKKQEKENLISRKKSFQINKRVKLEN